MAHLNTIRFPFPHSRLSRRAGFLCKLSANKYNIDFLAFKIRDIDSGETYFEVSKPPEENEIPPEVLDQLGSSGELPFCIRSPPFLTLPSFLTPALLADDSVRTISYDFPQAFLRAKAVGTAYVPRAVPSIYSLSLLRTLEEGRTQL